MEFIVDGIDPKIGDKIVDPFCGTGGFLIYAFEAVSGKIKAQDFSDDEKGKWKYELSNKSLFGTDWKERTSQSCKMNMMVHGDGSAGIFMHHGLVNVPGIIQDEAFNICLTNPPFGSTENDASILKEYELGKERASQSDLTPRKERNSQSRLILGIERAIRLVKPKGWIGIVVIDGVLNNASTDYVREYIRENTYVRASISLAKETFEGYGARAKTSILFLQKKETPNKDHSDLPTFFAIAKNTGYAANGSQIPGNELPDILMEYKEYLRGETEYKSGNCIVSRIDERLDAEFYVPSIMRQGSDAIIHSQVAIDSVIAEISTDYKSVIKRNTEIGRDNAFITYALGDILDEVGEKVRLNPSEQYKQLGVRWWGGGTFVREEKFGDQIKAKTLYKAVSGSIIYNRLFAFRGSFAILNKDHDDGYVSNEFPMFLAKPHVDNADTICKYIVHCLNSPQYLSIVDKLSTGSTKQSRNRFSQKLFLSLTINIPVDEKVLETMVAIQDESVRLRFKQEELARHLKEFQENVSGLLPNPNQ